MCKSKHVGLASQIKWETEKVIGFMSHQWEWNNGYHAEAQMEISYVRWQAHFRP